MGSSFAFQAGSQAVCEVLRARDAGAANRAPNGSQMLRVAMFATLFVASLFAAFSLLFCVLCSFVLCVHLTARGAVLSCFVCLFFCTRFRARRLAAIAA
jgi:hypothetical protein